MNYTEAVKKVSIRNNKKNSSLLLLMFCGMLTAAAQLNTSSAGPYQILGKSLVELKKENYTPSLPALPAFFTPSWKTTPTGPMDAHASYLNYQAPKAYSFEHLAFFCRLEVKMEKASKMPVRFRLGTVDYVDRLEGKY